MSIQANNLQKNNVPFVAPTDAVNSTGGGTRTLTPLRALDFELCPALAFPRGISSFRDIFAWANRSEKARNALKGRGGVDVLVNGWLNEGQLERTSDRE
jgi:hypothetical protein